MSSENARKKHFAIDFEFERVSKKSGLEIVALSIGIATPDRQSYYAEFDVDYTTLRDAWVKAHVVPLLGQKGVVKQSKDQIESEIISFIDPQEGEDITFWSDGGANSDFNLLDWVLGKEEAFCTRVFKDHYSVAYVGFQSVNDYRRSLGYKKFPIEFYTERDGVHNALADAHHTMGKLKWLWTQQPVLHPNEKPFSAQALTGLAVQWLQM